MTFHFNLGCYGLLIIVKPLTKMPVGCYFCKMDTDKSAELISRQTV